MHHSPSSSPSINHPSSHFIPNNRNQFTFSINQDCDCLCITLKNKFAVYSTLPNATPRLKTCITQSSPVYACTMLHKTNVLAFVSGAKRKKIKIYDDLKQRTLIELDSSSTLLRLILRRDCITTLSTHALTVYKLNPSSPTKLYDLPMTNIQHLATSNSRAPRYIVVTETQQIGHIQVLDLTPVLLASSQNNHQVPANHIILIKAHDSPIRALAVSPMGDLIVTASDRGTLIRVWDPYSGAMVKELRRGADPALIHSLLFSADGSRLVLVSDKGTVHLFHICSSAYTTPIHVSPVQPHRASDTIPQLSNQLPSSSNSRSNLAFLKPLLPSYFHSEWSFASCRIPLSSDMNRSIPVDVPPLLAWIMGESNKVMIVATDGRIWRFTFDQRRHQGGEGVLDGVWQIKWSSSDHSDNQNVEDLPVIEDL